MAIPQGSQGRLFVKKEATYGVDPTLAIATLSLVVGTDVSQPKQ